MSERDQSLIAEYDARRTNDAFAALVRQHINLVYATALRQVGDHGAAEEITQNVFVALAQASGKLKSHPTIAGWLYRTTLNKSREWVRSELRRHQREQVAVSRELARSEGDSVWSPLVPLLDEALMGLRESDRMAVIMHYMEGQTFHQVGSALGIGEDTARKRVDRCLDHLTQFFRRHGFAVPALTAGAPLFTLSSHAAPAGLAASVTSAGLAVHSATSTSTFALIKGALKIMAWSKTKTTIAAVAIALLGIGTAAIVVDGLIDALLPAPDVQGTWESTVTIPAPGWGVHKGESPKTRVVVRIAKVNGAYQANLDNIDQGHHWRFDTFTYNYPYIHAQIASNDDSISCVGKVNRSGKKMYWKGLEKNIAYTLELTRTINPPPFPEPLTDAEFAPRAGSALQGFWIGAIGKDGRGVHIQIKIAEASDGTFRGDFYCPDQHAERQPTAVTYDGATVKLMTMADYGMFEGRLTNGNSEMAGNWIQGGQFTPTTLTQANYSEYQIPDIE